VKAGKGEGQGSENAENGNVFIDNLDSLIKKTPTDI